MSKTDPCAGIKDAKEQLICRLRYAAELEQQFMCMYLYGAFSIQKRYVDDQDFKLSGAQLEISRRWASTLYTVARQEMEHLALVNNLLRSIDAPPCFARRNIPDALQHFHLGASPSSAGVVATTAASPRASGEGMNCDELYPIPQDFAFTQFDLEAVKRWTCMESPDCQELARHDAKRFADWCFSSKAPKRGKDDSEETVSPGTITEWYDEIAALFARLPDKAFKIGANKQVDILQQYDVYVFPVTDHASAQQAISLITEQGEGISASPTYQSHYRRFYDIVEEWNANGGDGSLKAYWDLAKNPTVEDIKLPYTRELFELFDHAYETLLITLTGAYATTKQNPKSYPYFAPALGQESFAPYMTMVIRSLAEALVQLRTHAKTKERAGPGFYICPELNRDLLEPLDKRGNLKEVFSDIDGITTRIETFCNRLGVLIGTGRPPVVDPGLEEWVEDRLNYVLVNATRIAANLRRIYQSGIYSAFEAGGY